MAQQACYTVAERTGCSSDVGFGVYDRENGQQYVSFHFTLGEGFGMVSVLLLVQYASTAREELEKQLRTALKQRMEAEIQARQQALVRLESMPV
jgi:hypothetical protein